MNHDRLKRKGKLDQVLGKVKDTEKNAIDQKSRLPAGPRIERSSTPQDQFLTGEWP
jgi:hypothetical protein